MKTDIEKEPQIDQKEEDELDRWEGEGGAVLPVLPDKTTSKIKMIHLGGESDTAPRDFC